MAHLKITITAKVPLPKDRAASVETTLDIAKLMSGISIEMAAAKVIGQFTVAQEPDDADPVPKPPGAKRGRKPRAASVDGVSRRTALSPALPPHPPTTGADGEDLLAIPPHLVRS